MISVNPIWDPTQGDEFNRSTEEAAAWRPGHTDEWYELIDVLAANMYVQPGQAMTAYKRYIDMFGKYNKPLMLSEFGSMSLYGADAPDDTLGSEGFHAGILQEAYDSFMELPQLVGYSPWCLNDIRVPIHWRWYIQGKGLFRYGMTDENGNRKKAFFTLKDGIDMVKKKYGQAQQ